MSGQSKTDKNHMMQFYTFYYRYLAKNKWNSLSRHTSAMDFLL